MLNMKKILTILFLIGLGLGVNGQQPITQNLGSDSTLIRLGATYNGILKGGIVVGSYSDTTSANATHIDFYTGAMIWATSDSSIYVRNKTATNQYWFKVSGAGGGASGVNWNIYGTNAFPVVPANYGVGTADATALPFKTNNIQRLIIPLGGIVRSAAAPNKYLMMDTTTKLMYYGDAGGSTIPISSLTNSAATNGLTIGHAQTWTSTLTTGSPLTLTSATVTSGNILNIVNTSVDNASGNEALNIDVSGVNANSGRTTTGASVTVANTGATNTNIGYLSTVSGGVVNYGYQASAIGSANSNYGGLFTVQGGTSANYGVYGAAGGVGARAVQGDLSGSTTNGYAGFFNNAASGATEYGIFATSTAAGTNSIAAQLLASGATNNFALNITGGGVGLSGSMGTSGQVLTSAGASAIPTWTTISAGTGDVVGPASATDNAMARFDLTTGKLIQNSVWVVADAGRTAINGTNVIYLPAQASLTGSLVYGNGGGSMVNTAGTDGQDNTYIGIGVGLASTTASDGVGIGYNALSALTTGIYNVAVGARALSSNTTGIENTAVGQSVLRFNNGDYNLGMGDGVMNLCLTCGTNVIVGTHGMITATTGDFNAGFGHNVFHDGLNPQKNTALGVDVLYRMASGAEGNVGIGYRTAGYLQGNHNVEIGYIAQALPYNTSDGLNISNGFFGYKLNSIDSTIDLDAEFALSGLPITDQKFTINTGEAGNKGLVVQMFSGQTARPIDVIDNGATSVFAVNVSGQLARYGGAFFSDGEIPIGVSSTGVAAKGSLTAGTGITVTPGAGTVTIAQTLTTAAGSYTPTLTNTSNIDASTAYSCQYMRVGATVTVSGRVDLDLTLTATSSVLGISLPISSAIANANEAGGTAFCPTIAALGAAILGDATNDRATLQLISSDVGNNSYYFSFTYRIL